MHDHKFENVVQQKMEGLVFNPPEAVWMRVEEAINKDKKRRVPLFWLFFLPGLLLVGAGGTYLMTAKRHHPGIVSLDRPAQADNNAGQPANIADGQSTNPGPSTLQQATQEPKDLHPATPQQGSPLPETTQGRTNENNNTHRSTHQPGTGTIPSGADGDDAGGADRLLAGTSGKPIAPGGTTGEDFDRQNIKQQPSDSRPAGAQPGKGQPANTQSTAGQPVNTLSINEQPSKTEPVALQPAAKQPMPAGSADKTAHGKVQMPDLALTGSSRNNVRARSVTRSDINKKEEAVKTPIQLKPKRSWEFGIAVGGGASSMNQALFSPVSVPAYYTAQNIGASITGATQKNASARIKAGFSAWLGIVATRPLSSRVNLTLGFNLHYYSTRMLTGEPVNDAFGNAAGRNSVLATGAFAAANPTPSGPYYPTGNDLEFTNRYYFMELPVSIQVRLNNSRNLPLFLEGGLAYSYMMGSDALYYDPNTEVYYKDGNIAHRGQFNISTALMLGLPVAGAKVQVGPQVQYGVTRLLDEKAAGDGHMFYGGLKIVVIPGKKKK